MSRYNNIMHLLRERPRRWLVTGVAGFIGSNLLESLLKLNQEVIGLDNFSTGHAHNLQLVRDCVSEEQWENFLFVEGDIRNLDTCRTVVKDVDYVLHQAAIGSVPRSIQDPIRTNENNVTGFLNVLVAARDENVRSFVYAASSSTYGDHTALPKVEDNIGRPLSPYAVSKYVNELYADVFQKNFGFQSIGLRYFNVFGPRQDPNGAYAAVIPKWIHSLVSGQEIAINGDGQTSRDFCYVENAVQANLLAACSSTSTRSSVLNVAVGERTTLLQLFEMIARAFERSDRKHVVADLLQRLVMKDFRPGDVRHSQASIQRATEEIGYEPKIRIEEGIHRTVEWFLQRLEAN